MGREVKRRERKARNRIVMRKGRKKSKEIRYNLSVERSIKV